MEEKKEIIILEEKEEEEMICEGGLTCTNKGCVHKTPHRQREECREACTHRKWVSPCMPLQSLEEIVGEADDRDKIKGAVWTALENIAEKHIRKEKSGYLEMLKIQDRDPKIIEEVLGDLQVFIDAEAEKGDLN